MERELKPCPFCGEMPEIRMKVGSDVHILYSIECDCGCARIRIKAYNDYTTLEEHDHIVNRLIEAWNTRKVVV